MNKNKDQHQNRGDVKNFTKDTQTTLNNKGGREARKGRPTMKTLRLAQIGAEHPILKVHNEQDATETLDKLSEKQNAQRVEGVIFTDKNGQQSLYWLEPAPEADAEYAAIPS